MFAAFQWHLAFAVIIDRFNSPAVLLSFVGLWLIFLIQWADREISVKRMIIIGMVFRAIYLLVFPELSDDVFRYIWDGMLTNKGISPYSMLPSEWSNAGLSQEFGNMLHQLNSPDYYSIYPPVLQSIFGFSVWLGNGQLLSSIIVLRVLVLLAELGSMMLIWKLLKAWKMSERSLMFYALNPLVIIEFAGNLHGEVFMVFFLLLSLWMLSRSTSPNPSFSGGEWTAGQTLDQRASSLPGKGEWPKAEGVIYYMLSAIVFGLSVGTKLLPIMFLPFYIKRLGWFKTAIYGTVVFLTVALLYVPFWTPDLLQNTLSSLKLYFANFEFNASFYYIIREIGFWYKGYNIIGVTAVWLPRLVAASILLIALLNKDKEVSGLPKLMLFAWFIYYAFATTVNPWYVAVLAAFLPFTKYRFALLWLMLVPLSYHAFGNEPFRENMWLIVLEYVPVYLWLLFELNVFSGFERKWALRRAEVKRKRLVPFFTKGETALEVGSGNGALTKLLRTEGMKMSALDIADKSLFEDVVVEVYDGEKFPFGDKQFHVCQLITMLHHTTNAEDLIREAKRVSHRVIVMEDIYESSFQKYLTWFTDSLVNWEFYGHPHTNRTDAEWKELFERNRLAVEKVEYYRFLLFFKQVTYVLTHAETQRKGEKF
jgi:SAM-dependent methyltransferase